MLKPNICFRKIPLFNEIILNLDTLELPSSLWAVHLHPNHKFISILSVSDHYSKTINVNKCVVLKCMDSAKIAVDVFINNKLIDVDGLSIANVTKHIDKIEDVAELIKNIENTYLCSNYSETKGECLNLVDKKNASCPSCALAKRKKKHASEKNFVEESSTKKSKINQSDDEECTGTKLEKEEMFHVCSWCDQSFPTKGHLKRHARKHTMRNKLYKCDVCNKGFAHKTTYQVHVIQQHETITKLFICDICEKGYKTIDLLKLHKKKHENIQDCKQHKTSCNCINSILLRCERKGNNYKCLVCEKICDNYNRLKIHMRKHSQTEDKSFSCDECQRSFTTQGNLQVHKKFYKET